MEFWKSSFDLISSLIFFQGDNPHKFCELCGSDTPGVRCTNRDPYAEYSGAFMCLKEKGDIAFLNEKTVFRNAENPDDFELLCPVEDDPNGALERRPVLDYEKCSWGVAPGIDFCFFDQKPLKYVVWCSSLSRIIWSRFDILSFKTLYCSCFIMMARIWAW